MRGNGGAAWFAVRSAGGNDFPFVDRENGPLKKSDQFFLRKGVADEPVHIHFRMVKDHRAFQFGKRMVWEFCRDEVAKLAALRLRKLYFPAGRSGPDAIH